MNWDAVGAIGEIVGAIAVVATLFYLARQINDGTRQSRMASVAELNALYNDSQQFERYLLFTKEIASSPGGAAFLAATSGQLTPNAIKFLELEDAGSA